MIHDIQIVLLDPNYKTLRNVPSFEPGVGHNWAVLLTASENGKTRTQTWADLDVLLEHIGTNWWDEMTYDVQHYIMNFVEPVFNGHYKNGVNPQGHPYRTVEFTRKGEED